MSFPRYPSYKDSGVELLGDVPAHWQLKRFKHVFKEREERSVSGEELLLSVSAYTGVSPRSEVIDEGDHLSRADSFEGYKLCYKDDLVVNIMLAWNRGLAFTAHQGIVSPAYCVYFVIDGSDPRFLNYLVRSNEYTLYFKAFSSGVIDSRLRIYPETFGRLFCGIPPLAEQTAIAEFLDRETGKIDELVVEQRRLMELLKEKRQAVISHAVTRGLNPAAPLKPSGIEWLGDVPEHWDECPLTVC
jgi:type I restriction enzyme S subunit